jgi:hypothetical protein
MNGSLPVLHIHTNSTQIPSKHPTVHVFVCEIAHAPPSFVVHHNEWTTIFRRTGNRLIHFHADRGPIAGWHVVQTFCDVLGNGSGDGVEMA